MKKKINNRSLTLTRRKLIDNSAKLIVLTAALLTAVVVFGIFYFLLSEGLRIFTYITPLEFFLNEQWYPVDRNPDFGILALMMGTLSVTGLTLLISVPMGFVVSIYLSEFSGSKMRNTIKSIVEFVAGMPSVVLGSFGLRYLSRWILETFPSVWTGLNILNASIILSILAMPYFVTLMEDSLRDVPRDQREASLSLGATQTATIFRVVVPQARSGVMNAIIIGANRVIGETMVVLMVAGGAAMIPTSVLDPVRPMTAAIAGEMGEVAVGSAHYHALFMIGVVLLIFSTVFTIIAMKLKRGRRG